MMRECQRLGIEEVKDLQPGMDFRRPEFRRETFLRFYEFHCKYQAHPGAVYYALPYIFRAYSLNTEQKLWLCFINGVSQNICSTYRLFQAWPSPLEVKPQFFRDNYEKFGWDVDRRYVKNKLEKCIESYVRLLDGRTQEEYFKSICNKATPEENFTALWDVIMNQFAFFGRLSTFSYMEYLKIAGLNIECNTLFLDDMNGSKSHRNGLCKVLGRDDLDWRKGNEEGFPGAYTKELLAWLETEASLLLEEAKVRVPTASYFTLESTLCCYKSWHRVNRRYPNVYNDMFWERIVRDERLWGERDEFFRQMRRQCLPDYLRVEDNSKDPGLKPIKQNWYRETGQVILMDREWPCFKNNFYESLR